MNGNGCSIGISACPKTTVSFEGVVANVGTDPDPLRYFNAFASNCAMWSGARPANC